MKQSILRFLLRFLAFILPLLAAVPAMASNDEFDTEYNFQAYLKDRGVIHMRLLVFSEGGINHYATWGGHFLASGKKPDSKYITMDNSDYLVMADISSVYLDEFKTADDKSKYPDFNYPYLLSNNVLCWRGDNDINKHKKDYGRVWLTIPEGKGTFVVTNLSDGTQSDPFTSCRERSFDLKRSKSGRRLVYLDIDWYMTEEIATKKHEIKTKVYEESFWSISHHDYDLLTYKAADPIPAPQIFSPVLYPSSGLGENGRAKVIIPYSTLNTPVSYVSTLNPNTPISINKMGGTIFAETSDTVTNFNVTMKLETNAIGATVDVPSNTERIPAYHRIHNFAIQQKIDTLTAHEGWGGPAKKVPVYRGHKLLTWEIHNLQHEDAMPQDVFEIQRAYKADFSDAVTIGTESWKFNMPEERNSEGDEASSEKHEDFVMHYAYVDSTDFALYNRVDPDAPIYYRIRRASSGNWGWDHIYAAQGISPVCRQLARLDEPRLLIDDNSEYQMRYERRHEVAIDITSEEIYGVAGTQDAPQSQNRWWDEHLMLQITRTGIGGAESTCLVPADSLQFVHTHDAGDVPVYRWWYRYSEQMPTPCAVYNYEVKLVTTSTHLYCSPDASAAGGYGPTVAKGKSGVTDCSFESIPDIVSITASQGDYKTQTALEWTASAPGIEYYDVYANGTCIAEHVEDPYYLDTRGLVGVEYEYQVIGHIDCRGSQTTMSPVARGYRSPYGQISGRITYPDGTAMADVKVHIYRDANDSHNYPATIPVSDIVDDIWVTTDADGVFLADGLVYSLSQAGTKFHIVPTLNGAVFRDDHNSDTAVLTSAHPETTVPDFVNTRLARFNGRVLFEGSSIPVKDVAFELNGTIMKDANGHAITTNALGNFDLTVPMGSAFTLRAVKPGHTFLNDGFFQVEGSNLISLNESKDAMRIFDLTKVRLVGRVAGGDVEGQRELGFGLSTNNLGDDLQLVLELEGDNVSHLVYYEQDLTINELDTTYQHKREGQCTDVKTTQKRIIISPDPVSGEFQLDLFPARYRLTQATAKGYSSLFAAGTAHPVIDLTNSLDDHTIVMERDTLHYNDTYRLIYHAPIDVTYQQTVYGYPVEYLGEKTFDRVDLMMQGTELSLIKKNDDGTCGYALGHPVFASGNVYNLRVQAHEDYYYNNESNGNHSRVMMKHCPIKIYNGLESASSVRQATLDDDGTTNFIINANNPNFLTTGADALRSLSISVLVDGQYVEANPLRAFVTGTRYKGQSLTDDVFAQELARKVIVNDVLRDPPGANSYAWIESGTSYDTHLLCKTTMNLGADIKITMGSSYQYVAGTATAMPGPFQGTVIEGSSATVIPIPAYTTLFNYTDYAYKFTTTERIQTSSDPLMTGRIGTVFIGTEPAVYALRCESFTILDEAAYNRLLPAVKSGGVKIVAQGTDGTGAPVYLAVCEEISYGAGVQSQFVYTENHILTRLLPSLITRRNALIASPTTSTSEIQALADRSGRMQYRSLVALDDDNFGIKGSYESFAPKAYESIPVDEVAALNDYILQWVGVIQREEATLIATRYNKQALLSSYDVTAPITYSERTHASVMNQTLDNKETWLGLAENTTGIIINEVGGWAIDKGLAKLMQKMGLTDTALKTLSKMFDEYDEEDTDASESTGKALDSMWGISIHPVVSNDRTETNGETYGVERQVGFCINDPLATQLNVDVYRVTSETCAFRMTSDGILQYAASVDPHKSYDNTVKYADFVYYLNGGATRCPHEEAAETYFYMPGTLIDAGTQDLEIPHLSLAVSEISNIPADESAYFNLTVSLDSDFPGFTSRVSEYRLRLLDESNPGGARLFIDGEPISAGRTFHLVPGQSVYHKQIELKRGEGYDYEDIRLRLERTSFNPCGDEVTLSAHFIPSSSPVELARISDNWVLNTLSPRDSVGYYLPVEITGYDYRKIDHIELQYKLTSESDDAWVNLCSYYANDSIYNLATGTKQLITQGTITGIHFYGERDPMEQQYDLRAVSFTRYGSGYVTRSSKVYSGRKDTRLPEIFGAVTPRDGILGPGDYIGIPFSEDIAGNYLDEDNNFQVVGYTNNSDITNTTSLRFDGSQQSAISHTPRSLGGNGFTIDMLVHPTDVTATGTYFSTESTDSDTSLRFGQRGGRLFLHMCGDGWERELTSKTLPANIGWSRVTATYNSSTGRVAFYLGTENYTRSGSNTAQPSFNVSGNLLFGAAPQGNDAYNGHMLEARIWDRQLDHDEIANYAMHPLTGYERGLLAYYPMNEGEGTIADDHAHGASLTLSGTSWTLPAGRSIRFESTNKDGIQLEEKEFSRTALNDYTLSLWFKASPEQPGTTAALLAAGRGSSEEVDAEGRLFVGLEDGHILVAQNGHTIRTSGNYLDNAWHNVCLTVAHDYHEACLYVDGEVSNIFSSDSITGIKTDDLRLGACHWSLMDSDGYIVQQSETFPFVGYIDDVCLLSTAVEKAYYQKALYKKEINPDDMTLLCQLKFQDNAISDFGEIVTQYSPYNARNYYDQNHHLIADRKVRLVKTDDSIVRAMTSDVTAPIRSAGQLKKMKFSWISKANELIVNLNMPNAEINHQNIFLTVRDVEDKAGNVLANPVTMSIYVDRNALKWQQQIKWVDVHLGETSTFSVDMKNRTGKSISYVIEDLPDWLTCPVYSNIMPPSAMSPYDFFVSNSLPCGVHSALVHVTDQDGLSDPLLIVVNVMATEPEWNVSKDYTQSMNFVGRVMTEHNIGGESEYYIDTDKDLVGAFVAGKCVGKQYIDSYVSSGANLMMNIYGTKGMERSPITFLLWQAKTNKTFVLQPATDAVVNFAPNTVVGTLDAPVVLKTFDSMMQNINVKPGWNWISFNVETPSDINSALIARTPFATNDIIKSIYNDYAFASYTDDMTWEGSLANVNCHNTYMMYAQNGGRIEVYGKRLKSKESRTVYLKHGWNELPFLSEKVMSVNHALSDYWPKASEGDIVKSYDAFALYDEATGNWIGSLKQMVPGCGYMLRHAAAADCSFTFSDTTMGFDGPPSLTPTPDNDNDADSRKLAPHATSMSILATAESSAFTTQPGDVLIAYDGSEEVGRAMCDEEGRFFLTAHADASPRLSFGIERDGVLMGSTAPMLTYNGMEATGTLTAPYSINFDETTFAVGPSPFDSMLTWTVSCRPGDSVTFELYDSAGVLMTTHSTVSESTTATYTQHGLDDLPAGIYVARVVTGQTQRVAKVMKR